MLIGDYKYFDYKDKKNSRISRSHRSEATQGVRGIRPPVINGKAWLGQAFPVGETAVRDGGNVNDGGRDNLQTDGHIRARYRHFVAFDGIGFLAGYQQQGNQ